MNGSVEKAETGSFWKITEVCFAPRDGMGGASHADQRALRHPWCKLITINFFVAAK